MRACHARGVSRRHADRVDLGRLRRSVARGSPERVVDLTEAVARAPEPPRFRRRAWRLAVFDPCHLRHAQGIVDEPRLLADRIAREVVELRDAGRCCGAAGVYALEQPELSARLRADRVAAIGESAADAVLCGNPGCALQLRQGLAEVGLSSVRVLHPAELAITAATLTDGRSTMLAPNT